MHNDEQTKAIEHVLGPCALIAMAGSGKTRALVYRIAHLIEHGHASPSRILAVTFSAKAAEEMNSRLKHLGIREARVGTWHSLCLEILQTDGTPWSRWEVDDTDRAKYILKDVLGYKHMNWKGADLGEVQRYITICKAHLAWPQDEAAAQIADDTSDDDPKLLIEAYGRYQLLVEERGLLTFDDFLMFTHRHLSNEENRARWAAKWTFLLQDEAQDANFAQTSLAEMLARDHCNYMIVGDPNQSLYSFRGCKPEYINSFREVWDSAEIVMHRNYRSGRKIVEVANAIIRKDSKQEMLAERDFDGVVKCVAAADTDDEGQNFGAWVEYLHACGSPYSDIVGLFRGNSQSRALEEALLRRKIPYAISGGTNFYDRKEVRDLLSYLRVGLDRDSSGESVARCLNAPFRFLGRAFLDGVMAAKTSDMTWAQAVLSTEAQPRQRGSVEQWVSIIDGVAASKENAATVLGDVVHKTRYLEWIQKDEGEESAQNSHVANVHELLSVATKFASAGELLDYVDNTLRAAKMQKKRAVHAGDRVMLMTVHKAKGLEWPHVFVAGCNEGQMPHAYGDADGEERRIMYVAVTRARDSLVLSWKKEMRRRPAAPSRYLVEAGLVKEEEDGEKESEE